MQVLVFCDVRVAVGEPEDVLAAIRRELELDGPYEREYEHATYVVMVDRIERVPYFHRSSDGEGHGL